MWRIFQITLLLVSVPFVAAGYVDLLRDINSYGLGPVSLSVYTTYQIYIKPIIEFPFDLLPFNVPAWYHPLVFTSAVFMGAFVRSSFIITPDSRFSVMQFTVILFSMLLSYFFAGIILFTLLSISHFFGRDAIFTREQFYKEKARRSLALFGFKNYEYYYNTMIEFYKVYYIMLFQIALIFMAVIFTLIENRVF